MSNIIKEEDIKIPALLASCKMFLLIFNQLSEPFKKPANEINITEIGNNIFPFIVNGAFAAELSLKYLSVKMNKFILKTHSLKELFDVCNDKLDLVSCFSEVLHMSSIEINNNIESFSEAFVEWRYIFEKKKSPKLNNSFFVFFVESVCKIALHYDESEKLKD